MELMGSLMRNGFLTSKAVTINGHEVPAIEVVRALLWENPITKHNPVWAYGLVVEVLGERDERQVRCIYRNDHPPQEVWGGTSAYYKNIGLPLAVGANLIAAGKVTARGVLPPEQALPVEPFFVALAQRGILVEEQILEEGQIVESGQIGSVS
jgi:saccharopine dehydrogenase-like NADP-dependent oxidoreductase